MNFNACCENVFTGSITNRKRFSEKDFKISKTKNNKNTEYNMNEYFETNVEEFELLQDSDYLF